MKTSSLLQTFRNTTLKLSARFVGLASTVALLTALQTGRAQDVVYPTPVFSQTMAVQSGIIDITKSPYNADKTGGVDCTAKITQAIADLLASRKLPNRPNQRMTIYFPSGTYAVSNTMDWQYVYTGSTLMSGRLVFQGQNRATTSIKLKDSAAGFSGTVPKPVIMTESSADGSGPSNNAYDNAIWDMTIDLGSGNSQAVGIDFKNNNSGSIRNVLVKASGTNPVGYAGITMTRALPGPGLLKNVEIQGLTYGIVLGQPRYGMTMENITLSGQSTAGILNTGNGLYIRKLNSTNSKTAIVQNSSTCFLTLLDSTLSGGTSGVNAIENKGVAVVRSSTTSGYSLAVHNTALTGTGTDAPAGLVKDYFSHAVLKGFSTSSDVTMNLPIAETPTYTDNNFAHWVSVTDPPYNAVPNSDSDQTLQIQSALNSGKTTVYFPPGQYFVEGQLSVSGSVQRILGMGSVVRARNGVYTSTTSPKAIFTINTDSPLLIDNMAIKNWVSNSDGAIGIKQSGTQPLTLTNLRFELPDVYENSPSCGNLYLENIFGGPWNFRNPGQKIWARHYNPENVGTKTINNGCTLWVMGLKTERLGTAIGTTGGGQTEVLGGMLYSNTTYAGAAAFTSTNSSISLTYCTEVDNAATDDYTDQVEETQGAITADMTHSLVPRRGAYGSALAFYSGFNGETIIDNDDSSRVTLTPSNGWVPSTSTPGYYGANYYTNQGVGAGTKSVRYTPNISSAGHYKVYARWTASSNRPPVVPFKITYMGTSTTVNVNEQTNNGVWVLLGTFPFDVGTSGYVDLLTNGTTGYYVIADAVKFVFDSP